MDEKKKEVVITNKVTFADKVASKIEAFFQWLWSYIKRNWIVFALAVPLTMFLISDVFLSQALSLWVDLVLISTVLSGLIFYAFTKYQPKFIYGDDGVLNQEELRMALHFAIEIFKVVTYTGAILICVHYFNLLSK